MQAKITAGFIVFTVIILLILWVFQTFFMSGIYKAIKIFEIDRCCSSLSDLIISGDVENLPDMVKSVSVKYNICITVYRIDEGPYSRAGVEMADSHVNPFCYLHNIFLG